MRCYFMRSSHIVDVEVLDVTDDTKTVEQAAKHFATRQADKFDGFEVWDRARFIHRFPANGNGKKNGNRRKSAA